MCPQTIQPLLQPTQISARIDVSSGKPTAFHSNATGMVFKLRTRGVLSALAIFNLLQDRKRVWMGRINASAFSDELFDLSTAKTLAPAAQSSLTPLGRSRLPELQLSAQLGTLAVVLLDEREKDLITLLAEDVSMTGFSTSETADAELFARLSGSLGLKPIEATALCLQLQASSLPVRVINDNQRGHLLSAQVSLRFDRRLRMELSDVLIRRVIDDIRTVMRADQGSSSSLILENPQGIINDCEIPFNIECIDSRGSKSHLFIDAVSKVPIEEALTPTRLIINEIDIDLDRPSMQLQLSVVIESCVGRITSDSHSARLHLQDSLFDRFAKNWEASARSRSHSLPQLHRHAICYHHQPWHISNSRSTFRTA